MKYVPAFLFFFILSVNTFCQTTDYIKGKVVNGETGSAIANASVFITNTSKGTVSSSTGEFNLANVPSGTYDLVVSCIGFETQVYTYKASQLPLQLRIDMKPKADELQAVVVEPYEKDGWEKWGKFFTENFIGTSANAKDCSIKNTAVLHFRNSKKTNLLTVIADEPLVIENRALGYKIQYQLEGFSYNFKENTLFYFGYTLFTGLKTQEPKSWQLKNRAKAYNGSMQHFMSSLYKDSLLQNGFEVKRLFKTLNIEKDRVKKIYREKLAATSFTKDSSAYYERVLKQPDMIETYGKTLLTADSIVTTNDNTTKQVGFTDFLYVVYKNEKEDPEYLLYTHENRGAFFQRSVIFLLNDKSVYTDALGNYYMPQDLMSYGYWSWSEKIATMLPLDYK